MNVIVLIENGKPIRMNTTTGDIEKAWATAKHTVDELSSKYIGNDAEALLFYNAAIAAIKVLYEASDVHNLQLNADGTYKGTKPE